MLDKNHHHVILMIAYQIRVFFLDLDNRIALLRRVGIGM